MAVLRPDPASLPLCTRVVGALSSLLSEHRCLEAECRAPSGAARAHFLTCTP